MVEYLKDKTQVVTAPLQVKPVETLVKNVEDALDHLLALFDDGMQAQCAPLSHDELLTARKALQEGQELDENVMNQILAMDQNKTWALHDTLHADEVAPALH